MPAQAPWPVPAARGGCTRRQWLALGTALVGLPGWATPPRVEQRRLFGSPVELLLPDDASAAAAQALWRGLQTMDREWNAWKPGEVSTLNRALREERSAPVSPALAAMIAAARHCERASGGCFNAGIGGLVGAWGFHADVLGPGPAPPAAAVRAWVDAAPSLAQLQVEHGRAFSRHPRLQLDFGGIGKGVALDWAMHRLERSGGGLLNLGGNLAACGDAGGRPWRVGIRDPLQGGLLATLITQGREAVVTSGHGERARSAGGEQVSHVLDPRTGRSAPGLASVTVVHRSATLADAAATALLVAGPGRWRGVARRMGARAVLAVMADGTQVATPAMAARLLPAQAAGPA